MSMDARLRCAVDASMGWYEDIFMLHGIGSVLEDGLWSSLGPPPPLHSDAEVVEPNVSKRQVLDRLEGREHCGFKDSFARIDPSGEGMELLFAATWMYRDPAPQADAPVPGWAAVTSADELATWTGLHDTTGVLLPALLERAHIKILARYVDGQIAGGAVARLGSGVVDVSNVYSVAGHAMDWGELAGAVSARFPGRPLVGYERGDALEAALDGGFVPTGDLRIWVR